MGTRALVNFIEDGKTIATVYRQLDGYPDGLGQEIKNHLKEAQVVNGFQSGMDCPTHFNGMGCLAAYLIGQLKINQYEGTRDKTIGNVYMVEAGSTDHDEEYVYDLEVDSNGKINLTVTSPVMDVPVF